MKKQFAVNSGFNFNSDWRQVENKFTAFEYACDGILLKTGGKWYVLLPPAIEGATAK